ncbi:hypothetical protein [Paenibacillus sp. ISL-20]|uniref:hypothetical protein n=1 Tax=Paenibacillus sp. ISL-20 TaxID=2819163 RepID=UPI001BED3BC6|nr:hypothetical protein [Paenibacillus sp. ISL-20]MBT2759968.1 hypothetical protein [Paenibacillus sp. ISL-20]
MYNFYAILVNEKGSTLVKGFENATTRLETEIAAEEYAKLNGFKFLSVYPVQNKGKQGQVLTKSSKERRATLGHR